MSTEKEIRRLRRHMTCCVCGAYSGHFQQHWNRDTGFGICRDCVEWLKGRGTTLDEIKNLYGVEGINYAAAEVKS